MGMRKLRARKYKSINEYYKDSDPDKKTIAHYISYWVEDPSHKKGGTTKKERVNTLDPNEALKVLNERKEENIRKKKDRDELKEIESSNVITVDQVATEYFQERKKTGNLYRDMKKYVQHIGDCLYETITINSGKGYRLTNNIKSYEAYVRGKGYITRKYKRKNDDNSLNLGNVIIQDVDPNVLMRLIISLENKGLSPKTVSNNLNLLKAIINHAISEGYILRNPFLSKKAKVDIPKEDRKRLFTTQEIKEIFIESRRIDKRMFMLFKMLYYTGQRPKSILALRVRDIDLNQKQISIDSIKEQSATYVPISNKLYPLLSLWIKGCDSNDKLFNIEYVTFQMKTQKLFAKYNKGLDYKKHRYQWASMYTFRHTSATVMLAKTNNIKTVQTVLNHSDPKVTAIYAKLLNDAKMEGVNVL